MSRLIAIQSYTNLCLGPTHTNKTIKTGDTLLIFYTPFSHEIAATTQPCYEPNLHDDRFADGLSPVDHRREVPLWAGRVFTAVRAVALPALAPDVHIRVGACAKQHTRTRVVVSEQTINTQTNAYRARKQS